MSHPPRLSALPRYRKGEAAANIALLESEAGFALEATQMFYVALIFVCLLMLVVFFGVTIAGGRAHDRQNRENALKAKLHREDGADS